jgi:hypothetical protein
MFSHGGCSVRVFFLPNYTTLSAENQGRSVFFSAEKGLLKAGERILKKKKARGLLAEPAG